MTPVYEDEAMLLDWSESRTGGPVIKLLLPSSAHLEPWKALTVARKGVSGQRIALVAVLIGDDEKPQEPPQEQPKGGELAKLAGRLCGDHAFLDWLEQESQFAAQLMFDWSDLGYDRKAELAADLIRSTCNVKSRAELDHDQAAKKTFDLLFRIPYARRTPGN